MRWSILLELAMGLLQTQDLGLAFKKTCNQLSRRLSPKMTIKRKKITHLIYASGNPMDSNISIIIGTTFKITINLNPTTTRF